jgi:26S proteasome regulatory subunit T1
MGECPELIIETTPTTNLFNIPAHVEYVVFELLKNSMRATVEHSRKTKLSNLPPIIIKTYSSEDVKFEIILEDVYRDP